MLNPKQRPNHAVYLRILRGIGPEARLRKAFELSAFSNDALRVYEVQYGSLDHAYLDAWAAKLGVADLLLRLREQAEQI